MKAKIYTIISLLLLNFSISSLQAQVTPCNPPTGMATTNISQNSANASWATVNGAVIYNVRYRLQSQPNNAWTVLTTQIGNITLGNLLCNSGYEWQVQSGCPGLNGALVLSNFTGSTLFTTLSCTNVCPVPTGLFVNNITSTSAKLHWNNTGASNYRVRYRKVGTATWSFKYPAANQVTVSGLQAASLYEWQVRSKCLAPSGTVLSNWSNTNVFQTTGGNNCPVPTNLTAGNAGAVNSKSLQWSNTGASYYNVRYRGVNTATWTSLIAQTNSIIITNLLQNASYEWQVQSVCLVNGAIILSAWSASAYFTNPAPMELSPNPASEKLFLNYQAREEQPVTITIHDFLGVPMTTESKRAFNGSNEYEINIANLKNGFYYLIITTSEGQQASRFCVKK